MSSHEINIALKCLTSSSEKHIYNGLVSIRTKLMKNKNAEKQLRLKGVIGNLLSILRKQDLTQKQSKLTDIILSILGNFCMEEAARADVLKVSYGINCITDCVIESSCISIQNRAARTIANLARSPVALVKILQTEVLPRFVTLLLEAKTKESQLIYCRTLRLIGVSNSGKDRLLDENGVYAVAKLMSSDVDEVVKNSLRTIAELSVSGCSFKFARQILAAGVVNVMVEQIQNSDNTISHNALSTVIRLTEFEYIRPVIGSAGGIPLFINLLSDNRQHIDHVKVMNVLCLCGKESVNRVKIRENGALQILLSALDGEKFVRLHDRIISSFLSYLYDEHSLNLLLDNRLIELLLRHLQRCTEFSSKTIAISFYDENSALNKDVNNTSPLKIRSRPNQIAKRSKLKICMKKTEIIEVSMKQLSSPVSCQILEPSTSFSVKECSPKSTNDSNVSPRPDLSSNISITVPTTRSSHVYSIDSPTYQNHFWDQSPLSDLITCKRSFSPVAGTSRSQSSYSPLSHDSYSSPYMSSPPYSIPSPGSSDMPYSSVWSQPYHSDSSDDLSPFSTSVADAGVASNWTFSSSEDDEVKLADEPAASDHSDITDEPYMSQKSETIEIKDELLTTLHANHEETMLESDNSDEMSTFSDACSNLSLNENKSAFCDDIYVYSNERRGKHKRTPSFGNIDTSTNPKRQKTLSKRLPTSKITESNIMILLSRVSVINDPSQYLATPLFLSCMLDYIQEVPNAQSRCVRTLSRILRDPLCLDSLINICAPVLIYQKLILNEEGIDISDVRSLVSKSKTRLSIDSTSSWISSFSSPRQSSVDFSPDPSGKPWNFPTNPGSPTSAGMSLDYAVASPHFMKEDTEEPTLDVEQTGLKLLRDLSLTAESPFGQGAITHTLLRKTKAERLSCCLSLQFLCWSSSMQDHFLVKHFTLNSLLEVIKACNSHAMLPYVVSGLNFLARMCNVKRQLTKDNPAVFPKLSHTTTEDTHKCPYWNCNHDVFFQVSDQQLAGNREILVTQSPVFAAMLEGHYCESNQSEIDIQDTPHDAFLFILHYLHGCDLSCPYMSEVYKDTKNIEFWENVLSLSDRYLCQLLTNFLTWLLMSRYLNFDCYFHVFMYSAFHGFASISNECVRMLFSAKEPVILKVGIFKNIIQNNGTNVLCSSVKTVFSEYMGKSFK